MLLEFGQRQRVNEDLVASIVQQSSQFLNLLGDYPVVFTGNNDVRIYQDTHIQIIDLSTANNQGPAWTMGGRNAPLPVPLC
jgi:hypothetical protein